MLENQPEICSSVVPTGFPELDEKVSGLHSGDLIVVAGDQSMGKTTLAINLAKNLRIKKGGEIVVFCDRPVEWISRLLKSIKGSIGLWDSVEVEEKNHRDAQALLSEAEFFFRPIPRSAKKISSLSISTSELNQQKPSLIVIDDLEKIRRLWQGFEKDRYVCIAETLAELKSLARTLNVPVIALAPLKERKEARKRLRPKLSDLPNHSAFKKEADIIMLMYRDEYYNPDSPDKGLAEIVIEKNNHGEKGTCKLKFNMRDSQIKSLRESAI